jgi:hypothetical protein
MLYRKAPGHAPLRPGRDEYSVAVVRIGARNELGMVCGRPEAQVVAREITLKHQVIIDYLL